MYTKHGDTNDSEVAATGKEGGTGRRWAKAEGNGEERDLLEVVGTRRRVRMMFRSGVHLKPV